MELGFREQAPTLDFDRAEMKDGCRIRSYGQRRPSSQSRWVVRVGAGSRPSELLLVFLMPKRTDILPAHKITAVALHLGVFQGNVIFLREALW